jgi:hypothetical protein
MDVKMESLYSLVGKSFTVHDGTIMDIFMLFQAAPVPFYMVTMRDSNKLHQVDVMVLFNLIKSNAPKLLEDILLD